ncbi:MAG: DNA gyrase inhibitor YacG [Nitrospinae bacterium]|nr:DNA gyrase inhibitor YacG [Nitrospinota bacterium]
MEPVSKKIKRCPICRKDLPEGTNPFRPFCSERCKTIDLGSWLDGKYRVPDPEPTEDWAPPPA